MSCSEVMYGAYYPYLYGRASNPRTPFAAPFTHQYERFNTQDLYSSSTSTSGHASHNAHSSGSGVSALAAAAAGHSSGGSVGSGGGGHSPCNVSPLLAPPPGSTHGVLPVSLSTAGGSGASGLVAGALPRGGAKEEDLSIGRSSTEGPHADSDSSSGPDSPGGGGASAGPGGRSSGGGAARAQYVSASCVVFTHYSGDVANVVDEHFSRALSFPEKGSKDTSPMTSRNFPPSFWNSQYQYPAPPPMAADLYGGDGGYPSHHTHGHAHVGAAVGDPWTQHYQQYHRASLQEYHNMHHNMHNMHNMQYSGLLLPTAARLPQQYGHSSRLHHDQPHGLETAAYSSYPSMAGLEAQVQESSKDLYWF